VDETLVNEAVVFVSDHQSAEAADPGDGALDFPAAAVAAEFASVLSFWSDSASAMRADQVPSLGQQVLPQFVAVVGAVGD